MIINLLFFNYLAGIPAAIESGGISFVTILPAATIEFLLIVTPLRSQFMSKNLLSLM